MLLAEDLLLLVTDDTRGKLLAPSTKVDLGLGGANLLELVLMSRVDLTREGDDAKPGRLVVRDTSPIDDPVLDAALATVARRQGKRPSAVITPLSKKLRRNLYQRLADRGVVRAEAGRILGIFPTRIWPTEDASHEEGVRRLVTDALVHQRTPDGRTAALIALLHALQCEHKIVEPGRYQLSKRELRARAEEIATGSWASEAVRAAIDEALVAVVVAVSAVVTASGSD